jgi:hypothetical protein
LYHIACSCGFGQWQICPECPKNEKGLTQLSAVKTVL